MKLFFKDVRTQRQIGWDILVGDICSSKSYKTVCFEKEPYEVFKHLILSLLLEEEVTLLDSDFSGEEIEKLLGDSKSIQAAKQISDNSLKSLPQTVSDLRLKLSEKHPNWRITLFTSGTTGIPKKVEHSFQSISRFVKQSESRQKDIWGFAYNPTHMAGLQVFFQALLNGNTIVYIFGLSKDEVFHVIKENQVSHISATPTFYRLLLPADTKLETVKRITSGGEKLDKRILEQLNLLFPNAKITNVYASTEAGTLFASNGDTFEIKAEMNDLVKIIDEELNIHHSLLGQFSEGQKEWYATGDLVEIESDNPLRFRFKSRKNEMINVGGYKVNPSEVEEVIRQYKGVREVRVYSKKNSVLGSIVCCEVQSNENTLKESEIRNFLRERLQEYKIPRMIKFVDNIVTTRTGKLKRS